MLFEYESTHRSCARRYAAKYGIGGTCTRFPRSSILRTSGFTSAFNSLQHRRFVHATTVSRLRIHADLPQRLARPYDSITTPGLCIGLADVLHTCPHTCPHIDHHGADTVANSRSRPDSKFVRTMLKRNALLQTKTGSAKSESHAFAISNVAKNSTYCWGRWANSLDASCDEIRRLNACAFRHPHSLQVNKSRSFSNQSASFTGHEHQWLTRDTIAGNMLQYTIRVRLLNNLNHGCCYR